MVFGWYLGGIWVASGWFEIARGALGIFLGMVLGWHRGWYWGGIGVVLG